MLKEENQLLHSRIEKLIVKDHSCNERKWATLDLSFMFHLRLLEVGNDCFQYVEEMKLIGLSQLIVVVVKANSFPKYVDSIDCDPNRYFYVKNCEKLKVIEIGIDSFSDYSVCEIDTLPSLEEIKIGILGASTASFSYSSLELNSFIGALFIMDRPPEAEITPLWSLRFRWLFSGSV